MKQSSMIIEYSSPAQIWDNGLPLGNGNIGAMRFRENPFGDRNRKLFMQSFTYGLNKCDLFDRRFDETSFPHYSITEMRDILHNQDKKRFREFLEQSASAGIGRQPKCKPAGKLALIDYVVDMPANFEEKLDLQEGVLTTSYDYPFARVRVTSFVHATKPLLVIKVEDDLENTPDWNVEPAYFNHGIELQRDIDVTDDTTPLPEYGSDSKDIWQKITLPDGYELFTVARICKTKTANESTKYHAQSIIAICENPFAHSGHLSDEALQARSGEKVILCALVSSLDADDPFAEAKRVLDEAEETGFDALFAEHISWWKAFWSKSSVELADEDLERMWYFHLYQLASTSRKGFQCPGLAGLWNRFFDPPWNGIYFTDINLQMTFWPCFHTNHIELAKPFFEFIIGCMKNAKKMTQKIFGMSGVKFPTVTDGSGYDFSPVLYNTMISGGGRMLVLFWWNYLVTQDEEFLKDYLYPFAKEVSLFYCDYLEKGEHGRYHIFPSKSPEQSWGDFYGIGADATIDIAIIKFTLMVFLQAASLIGVEDDVMRMAREYLSNLCDYPLGRNDSGKEVLLDRRDANPHDNLYHLSLAAPIFPCGEITRNSEPQLQQIAIDTLRWYEPKLFRHSFGLLQLALAYTRLGNAEEAYRLVKNTIEKHRMRNLFISLHPVKDMKEILQVEGGMGVVQVINEMLIDAFSETVTVFPAWPKAVDAAFEGFRVQGGFEIASAMKKGRVEHIHVICHNNGTITIENPWDEDVVIFNLKSHSQETVCGGIPIQLTMQESEVIQLKPARTFTPH